MIVYIASYPRSGNGMTQHLIHRCFNYPTSDVYGRPKQDMPCATNIRFFGAYDLDAQDNTKLWNAWVALYDSVEPTVSKNQRFIIHGCKAGLTLDNRRHWAAEDTIFLIKTHELPFETYYAGEYVIQTVRHPGASLRSYYEYVVENHVSGRHIQADTPTLDRMIRGEIGYGSWAEYHLAWQHVKETMSERFLRLQFSNTLAQPYDARDAISALTGLPVVNDIYPIRPRAEVSKWVNHGGNTMWEHYYTSRQLELLWNTHKEAMMLMGYEQPDSSKAGRQEPWSEWSRLVNLRLQQSKRQFARFARRFS